MTELRIGSLFSGYGGLDLAVEAVLGGNPAWFAEYEPPTRSNPHPKQAAAKILSHHYLDLPNHGDITEVDWSIVEPVDVLTGGFPCQDVSAAGKRVGLNPGTRSGLWEHMAYAIDQLRPRLVVIENVRGLTSARAHCDMEPCPWCVGDDEGQSPLRALGAVLGDLADLGYDASWHGLRAADVGAPHERYRIFIVATDTRRQAVGLRTGLRESEPARIGRRRPDHDRAQESAPYTHSNAVRQQPVTLSGSGSQAIAGLPSTVALTDATSDRRDERWPEPTGFERGPDAADSIGQRFDGWACESWWRSLSGTSASRDSAADSGIQWGQYDTAIRRWEHVLGRPAPAPTEPGRTGKPRLSPKFVEWLMGLPDGWVTKVPGISHNDQLKALGNGVVPLQAATAISHLLYGEEVARG